MARYAVRKIALDAVFDRMNVSIPGQSVEQVGIQNLPSSAVGVTELHFGDGDGIPLYLMGQSLNSQPAENNGIFVTNTVAQAGAVLVLIIGYAFDAEVPRQH